jgi:biotin transport system substrate-specific component
MNTRVRSGLEIAAAAAALAVVAQFEVDLPLNPIPQTLQSLVVVLAGAWLGPARGALAVLVYLAAGVVGLPVFAGGTFGVAHMFGLTFGYLMGFLGGAAFMGWLTSQWWGGSPLAVFGGALGTHAIILMAGWARLQLTMGFALAFAGGVLPFVGGAVIKSLLATAIWLIVAWVAGMRERE